MFGWLFAVPFIGTLINILTPAFKGIMEGLVEWAAACWHGVKTSNYGSWTLLGTVAVLVWWLTPCPPCVQAKAKAEVSRVETSKGQNVKEDFCHWFGC